MKNITKLYGILFIICLISIISLVIFMDKNKVKEKEYVDCYDGYGNKILDVACEDESLNWSIQKLLLFILFFSLVITFEILFFNSWGL